MRYAIAELHPRQFGTRGGVPGAIAQVAKAMKTGHFRAREIDINDFYPSFDGNKLVDLIPVPKRAIERVLLSEHLNIVPYTLHHTYACFVAADTGKDEASPLQKYLAE